MHTIEHTSSVLDMSYTRSFELPVEEWELLALCGRAKVLC